MFKNILVGVDGSACGERAARLALLFARAAHGRVTFAHVAPDGRGEGQDAARRLGEALLERWSRVATTEGVRGGVVADVGEDAAARLVALARAQGCDALVVGTHAREGLARLRLGSVAERVSRVAPLPVLLAREETPVDATPPWRVLVAVDGSAHGDATLRAAADVARTFGATVDVLHVRSEAPWWPAGEFALGLDVEAVERAAKEAGEAVLDAAARTLRESGVEPAGRVVERVAGPSERVGDAIVRVALDRGAQLVVVGTHGRGGLDRLLLGSVAERVAHRASAPVLLVRAVPLPAREERAAPNAASVEPA